MRDTIMTVLITVIFILPYILVANLYSEYYSLKKTVEYEKVMTDEMLKAMSDLDKAMLESIRITQQDVLILQNQIKEGDYIKR